MLTPTTIATVPPGCGDGVVDADEACDAAFLGGPVALAWSRFDADVRARVRSRYLETLETWRQRERYSVPGEFVIVAATATGGS